MYLIIKRGLDVAVCLLFLPIILIMIALLAIIIKGQDGGPIFFVQKRIGRNSKPFIMLKLRTMRVEAPGYVPTAQLQNPYAHITKIGRFMRRYGLDELPQVMNVLLGEMSLIGPRPHILQDNLIIESRKKSGADKIRPGMTGLAQVNGRDCLGAREKLSLDTYYAQHICFSLDAHIFFRTLTHVLKSHGYQEGKPIAIRQSSQRQSLVESAQEWMPTHKQEEIDTADQNKTGDNA